MNNERMATGWNEKSECRGVIVHEDAPTASRAESLWNNIVHDMGQNVRCDATFQPANEIEDLLDFEQAVATDIVILSVHDLARFLFTGAAWLDDWLATRSPLPRALFVLQDGEDNSRVLQFLQTISGFAGITLLHRRCEAGCSLTGVAETDRPPAETSVLAT